MKMGSRASKCIQITLLSDILEILNGVHYTTCINAHTLMLEAVWRLYWQKFVTWMTIEDLNCELDPINASLQQIEKEFSYHPIDKEKIRRQVKVNSGFNAFLLSILIKFYIT